MLDMHVIHRNMLFDDSHALGLARTQLRDSKASMTESSLAVCGPELTDDRQQHWSYGTSPRSRSQVKQSAIRESECPESRCRNCDPAILKRRRDMNEPT